MEARCLYFTVHSASNLINVRKLGEMKVYAKVSIAGNSELTEPDLVNKINPEWNKTFRFIVPEINIIQAQGEKLIVVDSSPSKDYTNKVNIAQIGATVLGAVVTGAAAFAGN
ncbi:hypothetical protein AABB24_021037 [Solanum stoloniferum]|uniref:C2 domain-containing protein n=1 Tax=Solanum stoloniferum TaxID=62892 RepID=A0ABD2STJ4_9SOLN